MLALYPDIKIIPIDTIFNLHGFNNIRRSYFFVPTYTCTNATVYLCLNIERYYYRCLFKDPRFEHSWNSMLAVKSDERNLKKT